MLLFIKEIAEYISTSIRFQYISCYSLSMCMTRLELATIVSIHLMLLFINIRARLWNWIGKVSIHLMLLFIEFKSRVGITLTAFQYISCYSLSEQATRQQKPEEEFQYISCYSLSAYVLFATAREFRFNTSHVTLYHGSAALSETRSGVSIHLMLLFIEKWITTKATSLSVSIHLMLLFIFLLPCHKSFRVCFNTSHVTLYPDRWENRNI